MSCWARALGVSILAVAMLENPNPLRQFAKRALSLSVPRRLFLIRGPSSSGAISLTFDDGPHPKHTQEVLEVLGRHRVRATFFVVGENARAHPELVRRIVQGGHELANHSWSHPDPEQVPARVLTEQARRTDDLLLALTGKSPAAYRPPRGKIAASTLATLWGRGRTVALWSIDPRDYEAPSQSELLARLAVHRLRGGDIVLLHDIHAHCAAAVQSLIIRARALRLGFVTVSQLSGRAHRPSGDRSFGSVVPRSAQAHLKPQRTHLLPPEHHEAVGDRPPLQQSPLDPTNPRVDPAADLQGLRSPRR